MHDLFLLHSVLHKTEAQKANQCFLSVQFKRLGFQCACYETEAL